MTRQIALETAFAKWPKARKIAVENATFGMTKATFGMAERMNLEADRASYSWKAPTMNAINFVIRNQDRE